MREEPATIHSSIPALVAQIDEYTNNWDIKSVEGLGKDVCVAVGKFSTIEGS